MEQLGVFDSGIGGFDVVSKLKKHITADIVFLADHKNLPYGNKPEKEMKEILLNNLQWFKDKNINHVLLACNTASTYIDYLRLQFPDMIIDSIIEITANKFKTNKNLMILGTKRTVASKVYDQHLDYSADYLALSQLASLVEENNHDKIADYLKLKLNNIDQRKDLLLACTHYSIVKDLFKEILNNEIYDSIFATVDYYQDLKGSNNLEVYSSANIKILKDQLLDIFNYDVKVSPMYEDFKIVVVSDNHGHYQPIVKVLEDNPDVSAFIHCGDVELSPERLSDFYVVNGNNDFFHTYPKNLSLEIGRLKVYVTHGHEHARYRRLNNIYKDGLEYGADIIFYGHEHIFKEAWIDGVLLLNPGSLFYNRDNTERSYAIITVSKESYSVKRMNI